MEITKTVEVDVDVDIDKDDIENIYSNEDIREMFEEDGYLSCHLDEKNFVIFLKEFRKNLDSKNETDINYSFDKLLSMFDVRF